MMNATAAQPEAPDPTDRGLTSMVGPVEVDWPRSIGFFGAVGAAVALDLLSPPVGIFIAAVPFVKMLNRPGTKGIQRFVAHLFEGAAKPVGADSEGTVRLARPGRPVRARRRPASRRRARARQS